MINAIYFVDAIIVLHSNVNDFRIHFEAAIYMMNKEKESIYKVERIFERLATLCFMMLFHKELIFNKD